MELHEREPYNFRINYYVNTWLLFYFIVRHAKSIKYVVLYLTIWHYIISFHENWLTIPPDDVSTDDIAWGD